MSTCRDPRNHWLLWAFRFAALLGLVFLLWFALAVCFEALHDRIAGQQQEWSERVAGAGGIEQDIESPPPKRTKSISVGRVSKED
jgi:hypothetical protein